MCHCNSTRHLKENNRQIRRQGPETALVHRRLSYTDKERNRSRPGCTPAPNSRIRIAEGWNTRPRFPESKPVILSRQILHRTCKGQILLLNLGKPVRRTFRLCKYRRCFVQGCSWWHLPFHLVEGRSHIHLDSARQGKPSMQSHWVAYIFQCHHRYKQGILDQLRKSGFLDNILTQHSQNIYQKQKSRKTAGYQDYLLRPQPHRWKAFRPRLLSQQFHL